MKILDEKKLRNVLCIHMTEDGKAHCLDYEKRGDMKCSELNCRPYRDFIHVLSACKEVETVGKVFHNGQWCVLIPESFLSERLEK